MFPSYGQEELDTEANCLVVFLSSSVILLEGRLVFSLSSFFKGQACTESFLGPGAICFAAINWFILKEPRDVIF